MKKGWNLAATERLRSLFFGDVSGSQFAGRDLRNEMNIDALTLAVESWLDSPMPIGSEQDKEQVRSLLARMREKAGDNVETVVSGAAASLLAQGLMATIA